MYSPRCRYSSVMNDWQNRMISPSERPLGGSKSEPPLAPPMGRPVSEFLKKICSKPRNFTIPQVHRRMKSQSALERAQRRIEFDSEAAVDLHGAGVVEPRHAEDDLPFGLAQPADDRGVDVVGMLLDYRAEAVEHLVHGLMELDLARVAPGDLVIDVVQFSV